MLNRCAASSRPHPRLATIRPLRRTGHRCDTAAPPDGPGISWYRHGRRHRDDGPAIELAVRAINRDLAAFDRPDDVVVVVHHLTFATVALPTFEQFIRRPGRRPVRLVVGPIGSSTMQRPAKDLRGRTIKLVRRWIGRANVQKAALTIAQAPSFVAPLHALGSRNVIVSPNAVVDPPAELRSEPRDHRRLVNVGLLISRKRQLLALETFAACPDESLRLALVGDGPDHGGLVKAAHRLGIAARVDFLGERPYIEALREIARSAVLLHTAASEVHRGVIAEAQTLGRSRSRRPTLVRTP